MIYTVSDRGPWIDLDEIIAIDDHEILMRSGVTISHQLSAPAIQDFAQRWISHRKGQLADEQPKRRSLS